MDEINKAIARSKQAALIALQNYDLDWDQIQFNQFSDTCTFIVKTNKGETFLLRIHSNMSREEIDSEIVWLDTLNERIDVAIPKGVLDRNGSRTVSIELDNDYHSHASLMCWVEGEHAKEGITENQSYKEGILLAKLHQVSQNFELTPGFERPVWGEQSFRQAMIRLTQNYDRFLTDAEFQLYQTAAEKILSWMNTLSKDRSGYGLIHGDLHQGNIVFHNEDPRPIDFGRCGFGYFLYDIAHTILGIYPAQRELVTKGYQSIRKLEEDWLPILENFTVMVMIENYSHHAPDPRESEGLKGEQPYAQAIIKHYLNGKPFLFNSIEV
ncbi:phosphotransferase enzyme family protein [Paenibacillus eucommiae]|uniref:Ser/Thr protein kinase RdoA (MazF antagonist) n=1 Tax=Paenibacillus eucommiae TaxID=1355755 RepID=A0ABS4IQ81_9BACL|nr:phosphotransferase [Paenibacillus eucommiae]MBP1989690.1 Ser/Thr protein kinase RdoA (MazF antagonist) [Paenibacillus eucommiae]